MASAPQQKLTAEQVNGIARQMIAAQSQRMIQQISSQTVVPANNPQITINPRMVGMIMGFWVKVVATVANSTGGGVAITPTNFGAANVLTAIQFNDLNNNVRVQTTGWHLNFLNTVKGKMPYGTAIVNASEDGINATGGYGNNWTVISQTASIADAGTGTVTMWYYVPLAYSDGDYRGAVYANVTNATMQLYLTFNPTPVAASTGDTTTAMYTAVAGAGSITSATVTIYQDYLDQIPYGPQGPILPLLDLSTIYELKSTIFNSITAANDFYMQYGNFRAFLSTFAVYYNGSSRGVGADINYWALTAANMTKIWQIEPALVALRSRGQIRTDFPRGVYYFSSRNKPINTQQYGNMQLTLNAITAGAGSYVLIGWEDFSKVNQVTAAGSLPGQGG